jgi:tRNA(Ser,Leu) C12 N-acetylase TAN1
LEKTSFLGISVIHCKKEVLANANKAIEKSTKFINKIKSRQLACANRAKSISENATIRKE